MRKKPKTASWSFLLISSVVTAATFVLPWILLLRSGGSPLYVHNPEYVKGFELGVFFVFFQLIGLVYGMVMFAAIHRKLSLPKRS